MRQFIGFCLSELGVILIVINGITADATKMTAGQFFESAVIAAIAIALGYVLFTEKE